ncbi:disease resistance protein RPM1-like [Tripterygium wilfordii]|uniref:Disease resistance protein RPM1-like n=2 Tax=Tripterygium wilfordii TaxID=458696 RepID=A0A7J7CXL1_TRIWF|nr:disease resistance protein RPM1-like [Tripterygium wilfordii]
MATLPMDFVLSKLASVIESEASLLGSVNHELHEIKRELEFMRSFLVDADKKSVHFTEGEKAWVYSVRDIAYDVEDIIDEMTYYYNREQSADGTLARFLPKIFRLPMNLWVRHHIGTKLHRVNGMIKAISERSQRYGVHRIEATKSDGEQNWVHDYGKASLFFNGEECVGIEDHRESLIHWLMDDEPHRTVISIVGMGGSGKTTLVTQAYNSPVVKRHFDCCAWASVSQNYVIEELLKCMIKEFFQATREIIHVDLTTMDYRELAELLVNFLKPLRYVIVLDDVWNVNLWTEINFLLPEGKRRSRILLTTRNEDVALTPFGVRSHIHFVQPLGMDDAWDLFCVKAFSRNPSGSCPPELQALAKKIVKKCEGLPLAIVALGGVMASKKTEIEWRKVYDSLNWELSNNPRLQVVKSVLLLSFIDLPLQLKQCFLYCSILPEDYVIPRKRLIRLWMAEGFVEEIRGLTPEEVAESYLMDLAHRSMLQVIKNSSGRLKACKMHDLIRELAISISEREKFSLIWKGEDLGGHVGARRLSVQSLERKLESWTGISQLRSFFAFVTDHLSSPTLYSLPSGFRLLRVLDLEFVPIKRLPKEIGSLFNLRYLDLMGTHIEKLPKSIEKLYNLQTLNLYQTKVRVLPSGIVKLQNLRYLIASYYNLELVDEFNYVSWTRVAPGITNLRSLQVLNFVEVNCTAMKHVHNLRQLTCLGMMKAQDVDEMDMCAAIENMKLLCHLTITASGEEEVLRTDALSSPPPRLQRLNLVGKLDKFPNWISSLQSLTALYLSWSRLVEDPLPYIQLLPKLRRLTLVNAYIGKHLCFAAGFLTLKSLILRNLPHLEQIIIEKGAMPSAQNLWLCQCTRLKMLPQGVEYLTNLDQVYLSNVSQELVDSIGRQNSTSNLKTKIHHYYQTSSGWLYESLS